MIKSVGTRLTALLAALAVVAASVLVASPASAASPIAIGAGDPKVTKVSATMTLTVAYDAGVVTEPGVKYVYQWYRVNRSTFAMTRVTAATHASYKLTSADYPYLVTVRVTVSKSGRTSVVRDATPRDYSLRNAFTLELGGGNNVGAQYNVGGTYFEVQRPGDVLQTEVFPTYPPEAIVWLRNGVPNGQVGVAYGIRAADVGKRVSARMTVT